MKHRSFFQRSIYMMEQVSPYTQVSLILPVSLVSKIATGEEIIRSHIRRIILQTLENEKIYSKINSLSSEKSKKTYQQRGDQYFHFSIRLPDNIWSVISELSHGTNLSRCKIVAELIRFYLTQDEIATPIIKSDKPISILIEVYRTAMPDKKRYWGRNLKIKTDYG